MKDSLSTKWTAHLSDPDKAEEFRKLVNNSTDIRIVLSGILRDMLSKPRQADYNCPSWPYLRAHRDGRDEAIMELLKIIEIPDHKE